MSKLHCICTYCGEKFTIYVSYNSKQIECSKCGDKNIKTYPIETGDVFGYNYKERKRRDE